MTEQEHWQDVYTGKAPDEQSWYQRRPDLSLELIDQIADDSADNPLRLVDIGGGASTLVDHLLEDDSFDVTVVDIAPAALEESQIRLGEGADDVRWVVADLTESLELGDRFDVWHDRAVFHFMTDDGDRRAYLDNLRAHLDVGGHLVLSTFAPEGPEKCSGLQVRRYSPELMAETLGEGWKLIESRRELHPTPWGGEQAFVYGVFKRVNSDR